MEYFHALSKPINESGTVSFKINSSGDELSALDFDKVKLNPCFCRVCFLFFLDWISVIIPVIRKLALVVFFIGTTCINIYILLFGCNFINVNHCVKTSWRRPEDGLPMMDNKKSLIFQCHECIRTIGVKTFVIF